MKYGVCACQATCEDPNGESGCHSNCSNSEGCACPDGFSMHGRDCIPNSECDCFVTDTNMIIPVSFIFRYKVILDLLPKYFFDSHVIFEFANVPKYEDCNHSLIGWWYICQ